jgi:hypothetical protein
VQLFTGKRGVRAILGVRQLFRGEKGGDRTILGVRAII